MSTRSRAAFAFVALLLCSSDTVADGILNPTTQLVGNMGEGVSNPSSASAPVTPCSAGQFDFSAGCNAIFFTGAMTP